MQFTPSQKRALDLTRHLGITANAGSGKTRVLVERYVSILEQDDRIHPRNIVAITFTEAAAAELRTRITKELDSRIENAASHGQKKRLQGIRDDLKTGYIGTIHSFATRLLRAYPVEANVDATFGILSGADERLTQEDAINSIFFDILQRAYDNGDEETRELLTLFKLFGRSELMQLMRTFLSNRSRIRTIENGLLSNSDNEVLEIWFGELERTTDSLIDDAVISGLQYILSRSMTGKPQLEAQLALEDLRSAGGMHARLTTYAEAFNKVFTGTCTIRKNLVKDPAVLIELDATTQDLVRRHKVIGKIAAILPGTDEELRSSHVKLLSDTRLILSLWRVVFQEYTERKATLSLLDFDDLIERTERLLSKPRVLDELVDRFSYIMIDEYQDTDETQFRIAGALTNGFSTQNKLTIVGDPKQSIYCFRNADASVFNTTLGHIAQQPNSTASNDGLISLQESFRMLTHPLAFINDVFATVMKPVEGFSLATEDVSYDPLVLGKSTISKGSVELLLSAAPTIEEDTEDSAPEEDSSEFQLIARKIQQIVQSTEAGRYAIEENTALRAPKYRDIAVLVRTRTQLPELEAALRDVGIPYIVRKGAGFFAQQEITDIVSYLKFLLGTSDDVSLLAILRSPLFALSDTLLFKIGLNTRRDRDPEMPERYLTFWERVQKYADATTEYPLLTRAVALIRSNLMIVGRVPITRLVEKIYSDSAIYAILSAGPHGGQKVANLKKLVNFARQADASGFPTLYDFVERLEYLMNESDSEAQADTAGDEPAVQIMTVHGAKGLEYPIVIAASMHKKFNFDRVRILDKQLGLMLSYPTSDKKLKKPAICELIRLRSDQNTIAEEKRVLYVQLTRAKDHLIVSGDLLKNASSTDTCLNWILNSLSENIREQQPQNIKLLTTIDIYNSETTKTAVEEVVLEIPVSYTLNDIEIAEPKAIPVAQPKLGKLLLKPIEATYRPERFSATQLLTYQQCPTKYYLAYGLGIPEEPKLAYDIQPDEASEKIRGALTGQILHRLFERIDVLWKDGQLIESKFEEHLLHVCTAMGIVRSEEIEEHRTRARKDISNFAMSDFGRFALSCKTYLTEVPIQSQLDKENTLYGVIDRLFQEPDGGTWHILDYKTETKHGVKRALKSKQYAFQLQFYANLIRKLYPGSSRIKSTVFYTYFGDSETVEHDLSSFSKVEDQYRSMISKIRIDDKIPELKLLHREMTHCKECNFFNQKKSQCVVPLD